MSWPFLIVELIKLGAQLAGALLVARLAVSWALARFKDEQVWARQLTAYADVLGAMGEMQRVLSVYYDDALNVREIKESEKLALKGRWDDAQKEFARVANIAAFMLPAETTGLLARIETDLQKALHDRSDYFKAIERQYDIVVDGIAALVREGRAEILAPSQKSASSRPASPS